MRFLLKAAKQSHSIVVLSSHFKVGLVFLSAKKRGIYEVKQLKLIKPKYTLSELMCCWINFQFGFRVPCFGLKAIKMKVF